MSSARGLVLFALALALHGCATWRPVSLEPGSAPVVDSSHPVRVTRVDGATVVLYQPLIVNDSLVGDVGNPPLRTAIALQDVRALDVLRGSPGRTAVAVGAGAGVGVLVVAAVAFAAFLGFVGLLVSSL